jgi:cytochrome b pre-mRNA-processing protein 3
MEMISALTVPGETPIPVHYGRLEADQRLGAMLKQWFSRETGPAPLYDALVGWARDPRPYRDHGVPDSLDGRFDMLALVMTLALRRLAQPGNARFGQQLMEHFVADMDSTVRELGAGDLGVGRRVRAMAEALLGRMAAYRAALDEGSLPLEEVLARNVYRGESRSEQVAGLSDHTHRLIARLDELSPDEIMAGRIGECP